MSGTERPRFSFPPGVFAFRDYIKNSFSTGISWSKETYLVKPSECLRWDIVLTGLLGQVFNNMRKNCLEISARCLPVPVLD